MHKFLLDNQIFYLVTLGHKKVIEKEKKSVTLFTFFFFCKCLDILLEIPQRILKIA